MCPVKDVVLWKFCANTPSTKKKGKNLNTRFVWERSFIKDGTVVAQLFVSFVRTFIRIFHHAVFSRFITQWKKHAIAKVKIASWTHVSSALSCINAKLSLQVNVGRFKN